MARAAQDLVVAIDALIAFVDARCHAGCYFDSSQVNEFLKLDGVVEHFRIEAGLAFPAGATEESPWRRLEEIVSSPYGYTGLKLWKIPDAQGRKLERVVNQDWLHRLQSLSAAAKANGEVGEASEWQPTAPAAKTSDEGGKWLVMTPKELRENLGITQNTLIDRLKKQRIRNEKITSKAYRIYVDDLRER